MINLVINCRRESNHQKETTEVTILRPQVSRPISLEFQHFSPCVFAFAALSSTARGGDILIRRARTAH